MFELHQVTVQYDLLGTHAQAGFQGQMDIFVGHSIDLLVHGFTEKGVHFPHILHKIINKGSDIKTSPMKWQEKNLLSKLIDSICGQS